jgi:asparagine synthase (glutamine-hydrolysing)
MYRFLALTWNPLNVVATRTMEACKTSAAGRAGWSIGYQGTGMFVLLADNAPSAGRAHALGPRDGVILGQLFERSRRDYSQPLALELDATRVASILNSAGQRLIDDYWGSYLAILYDQAANRHHVIRDPVGTLPCYYAHHVGVEIFFSRVQDCIDLLPLPWSIGERQLTKWLFFSSVLTDETALENVIRFPRGERLTFSATGMTRSRVWDPTAFGADPQFDTPEQAARELRATVQHAIDAWASCYSRITHRLSGGLDSSIVAGCLAHAASKPQLTFLNLLVPGGAQQNQFHIPGVDADTAAKIRASVTHGDERQFARMVAQRWNTPLLERDRDLGMDLDRLNHAPLTANPALYFTMMEMDDAELGLIATRGMQAFFSGQAGDAVFLATRQPLGAMDHAYHHGISRDLWRQIEASTALSRDSLWSVLGATCKHGLLRRPYEGPIDLMKRPTLLNPALRQSLTPSDLDGSIGRLIERSSLPPGKRNHVQGVAYAYYDFIFHAGERAEHIDPLNSQPVWEFMLRVPTYTLLLGGVSRGLARHAFADVLPVEIKKRVTKGTGSFFYQQLARRNRAFLRERLSDGLLVQQGYLDRRKVQDYFATDELSVGVSAATLLTYLAGEIWLERLNSMRRNVMGSLAPAYDSLRASPAACASEHTAAPCPDPDPRRTAARNGTNPRYGA